MYNAFYSSSIVQRVLLDAHSAGKQFRVIVVDSRPKMEGRHMLKALVGNGVKCSYVLINAVSYIMKEVGGICHKEVGACITRKMGL